MHNRSGLENSDSASFQKQFLNFEKNETFQRLINILPIPTIVCNEKRQVVYSNQKALNFLNHDFFTDTLGLRIGALFDCINASVDGNFCGEANKCKFCNASHSFIDSQLGKFSEATCVITQTSQKTIALDISANPYLDSGTLYSLISFKETASKPKNELFENIFLHDILNTASNIHGCLDVYSSVPEENRPKLFKMIQDTSAQLIDEIRSHQALVSAAYEKLKISLSPVISKNILDKISEIFNNNVLFEDLTVVVSKDTEKFVIQTDETLLFRVLQNLVKNALEASKKSSTVMLCCNNINGYAKFTVYNKGFIFSDLQSEIFKENTSTKPSHSGVGLYSVKLLTQKYLKGKVTFSSTEKNGTFFSIKIPLVHNFEVPLQTEPQP